MNKLISIIVITVSILTVTKNSYGLEPQQLQALQNAVVSMCRGGTLEGNASSYEIKGTANGKLIVIKSIAEAGADLKIEVSNEKWEGIKVNANSENYTECVQSTLPLLIPKE